MHSLSMKSASKRLHQFVGTRAKRVVKSGALSLLNMARESKVRLAKAIRSKTARHPKVKALLGKNSSPAPSISPVVLQLDHDYGTDTKEWLRYRKSLLKKTHLRKLGRCQREGKLWVCMSRHKTSERIDWKQLAATTSVLSQTQERPVELILHDDSDRHGTGQSPLPNVSIINDLGLLAEITADADSIIFIEVNDVVDKDSIRILEENNAFAADVVLFDFYYVDGPKAYPVTLHGVDPLHALHCDYFFSRFLVSSRLLKQVTRRAERGMSPRCVAVSCLSAADNCSTLHIAIPLLQAALDKPTIRIAKAKTEKHSRHTVDTTSQVSAVICTKDNHLLLRQLIWRLKGERAIKDIIVVSNNSSSQDMHALLSELSETGDAKVLIYNKPFNFSEQSNMGAMSGSSQSLLFINDDTTPVNDDWLELLLETSAWNGGSITGPLLVYPDQTVQHGGMFLGFNNTAGHCMRYSVLPDENSGFWLHAPRRVSSLTGAALLVPRAVFESLNGFDTMLGHYLQDVDFCMRASGMGVPVVFDPRSILIHFESLSVKRTLSDERVTYTREKEFEYFRRRWPILHDKWLNPRLSPDDEAMRSFVSL